MKKLLLLAAICVFIAPQVQADDITEGQQVAIKHTLIGLFNDIVTAAETAQTKVAATCTGTGTQLADIQKATCTVTQKAQFGVQLLSNPLSAPKPIKC